jgi:hypothetical protein
MSTSETIPVAFETLRVRREEGVVFATIAAPPMSLLGPELWSGLNDSRSPGVSQVVRETVERLRPAFEHAVSLHRRLE